MFEKGAKKYILLGFSGVRDYSRRRLDRQVLPTIIRTFPVNRTADFRGISSN